MRQLYDFHWAIEEREHAQYNSYVLVGSKGMALAYPIIALKFPEECYTRDEALLNATVAASAPYMLRLLVPLASSLEFRADEDFAIRAWRQEILKEIAEATGEIRRS